MTGRIERLGLLAVVGLAAVARLPGLASRGRFDADQGHDMLVLLGMTQGAWPLLGPRASVGDFHHGAFYYYLLSPAAMVSGADPIVVTAWLAILGIAAVALTWWLARSVAGPLAGLTAGLLMAVSPAAIEQSTFIWNPNPIPLFAALALGATWHGRRSGRAGWWAVAIGAAAAVVQLHVLGIVFLIGILAIVGFEAWRAGGAGRRAIARGAVGGLGLAALLFLPLVVHELQTGFLETSRVADYLASGDGGSDGVASALAFTLLRVVGWPLVGLVTDVPAIAAVVVGLVVALAAWSLVVLRGPRRVAAAWLSTLLAWSVVALALIAPSLQRVVAGLPNDHYHAFADPMVAVLVALAAVTLLERAGAAPAERLRTVARVGVTLAVALIVFVEMTRWPPAADPDGGWIAARDAGAGIAAASGGGSVVLLGLPEFKGSDGIGFPIVAAGAELVPFEAGVERADVLVVACDRLFEGVVGAACGGPAEDRLVRERLALGTIELPFNVTRFDASRRTAISIYAPR